MKLIYQKIKRKHKVNVKKKNLKKFHHKNKKKYQVKTKKENLNIQQAINKKYQVNKHISWKNFKKSLLVYLYAFTQKRINCKGNNKSIVEVLISSRICD